eukprot:CAMPEP_0119064636 /NCGR_PEP_ID=MMETSP1178-20130426/7670_1 /TAXON_ID=33656 /ORGANISM="unid sp, Strain CCMP2000" /LENGTH=87 /DNA_ID=CAMNT_0007046091 /DNA_START=126 /DNA_END=386 /DNA_ORIENTATION=-
MLADKAGAEPVCISRKPGGSIPRDRIPGGRALGGWIPGGRIPDSCIPRGSCIAGTPGGWMWLVGCRAPVCGGKQRDAATCGGICTKR